MALFGRERLPHRSTLSRFLASLDQATVDALRALLLEDVLARPVTTEQPGGHWDRHGHQWLIFDVDGTRQAARQRALPQTPDHPSPHRRLSEVCTPGYLGRKRGEGVRTRTTVLQAHTHQWLGTFGGAGNGDYRGDLKRAVAAIQGYLKVQQLPCSQGVVRLDGQYGNGSLVEELAGLGWILRGRDYHLLDLPQVQARLKLPPDQRTTHPETGTQRTLFDCPSLVITATGQRSRVPSRPCWLMRTRNKSLIGGVRTPLAGRSFGKSSRNGFGICASAWDMLSIPLPCARRSLLQPPSLLNPQQVFPRPQPLRMGHPPWRAPGSEAVWKGTTLSPNLMARCAVLLSTLSMPRNAARSAMGPFGWCMQRALAIAVSVHYGNAVSGTAPPQKSHAG